MTSQFEFGWKDDESTAAHSYLWPGLIQELDAFPHANCLDLGAGNGSTARMLARTGRTVACLEPSQDGLVQLGDSELSDVRAMSVYDEVPEDWIGKFEVVYSLEVIEHLYSPHRLFDFAFHALQPGGRLVVSTPYHGYIKNLAISLVDGWDSHWHSHREHGHIKFFSQSVLSDMAKNAGFEVLTMRRLGRVPMLASSMMLSLQKPS